jgi:predicted nucleic acid-binding Zn ribbon protein
MPGNDEARRGNDGPIVSNTTADESTVAAPRWGCTWCAAALPAHELACRDCLADVVDQLRRRREADRRLQPLVDLLGQSA